MRFANTHAFWTTCALVAQLISVPAGVCLADEEGKEAPVYLDQPPQPPPPRPVRRVNQKDTYKDESVHLEYQAVQMSDDTLVNDGPYVEYYRGGQKFQEGTFKQGSYEGVWTYWHPNGQICKSVTFKNCKPDGEFEVFRSDGTRLAKRSYEDGTRHGKWISYFDDGEQPMVEYNFDHGVFSDVRTSYYENGQKRQEIHFKDGKRHGPMIEYDETGKKTAEAMFEDGQLKGEVIRY